MCPGAVHATQSATTARPAGNGAVCATGTQRGVARDRDGGDVFITVGKGASVSEYSYNQIQARSAYNGKKSSSRLPDEVHKANRTLTRTFYPSARAAPNQCLSSLVLTEICLNKHPWCPAADTHQQYIK